MIADKINKNFKKLNKRIDELEENIEKCAMILTTLINEKKAEKEVKPTLSLKKGDK